MIRDMKLNLKIFTVMAFMVAIIFSMNIKVFASGVVNEETRKADYNSLISGTKLYSYLSDKYPALKDDTEKKITTTSLNNNTSAKCANIEIKKDDQHDIDINMVNLNLLGEISGVDTLVIDGMDEIRTLYLPPDLKHLTIKNSTLNFTSGCGFLNSNSSRYSYGLSNVNLESLVLENVTIGNRFENDEGVAYSYTYVKNNTFDISNCSSLTELKVDVKFESSASSLVFDAGNTYTFSGLSKENCWLNNLSSCGNLALTSTNSESFFNQNGYTTADAVVFNDSYFKKFIRDYRIDDVKVDKNGDGILTSEEISRVTNLVINIDTVGTANIEVLHDFTDLEKFTNLQNLTIDLSGKSTTYIGSIAFPGASSGTGSLNKVSIKNTRIKVDSMTLPSLKELEYENNNDTMTTGQMQDYNPSILIKDTKGLLSKITITDSDLSGIEMNNGADKRNLELYVTNCPNLLNIQFTGTGYTLLGDVTISDCKSLKGIGKKTEEEGSVQWQIDGAFIESTENNSATFNLSDCSALGDDVDSITLNCIGNNRSQIQKNSGYH